MVVYFFDEFTVFTNGIKLKNYEIRMSLPVDLVRRRTIYRVRCRAIYIASRRLRVYTGKLSHLFKVGLVGIRDTQRTSVTGTFVQVRMSES